MKKTKIKTAEEIIDKVKKDNERNELQRLSLIEKRKPYVDELLNLWKIIIEKNVKSKSRYGISLAPWDNKYVSMFMVENEIAKDERFILSDALNRRDEIVINGYDLSWVLEHDMIDVILSPIKKPKEKHGIINKLIQKIKN